MVFYFTSAIKSTFIFWRHFAFRETALRYLDSVSQQLDVVDLFCDGDDAGPHVDVEGNWNIGDTFGHNSSMSTPIGRQ